ncbi:hypothetical protein ABFS83_06G159000 [Erythranthe nasuta]
MKILVTVFLIVTLNIFLTPIRGKKPKCFFTTGYEVYVVNNLPASSPPLLLNCASKDDKLGNHTLYVNQDFHFHFCESVFADTTFSCEFRWESKEKLFDVFNAARRKLCGKDNFCYWAAKSDGIYFSNDSKTKALELTYNWEINQASRI